MAVNAWDEEKLVLQKYIESAKLKQRVLLNGSAVADLYKVEGLPTSLWVDREGKIMDVDMGQGDTDQLESITARLVNP